EGVEAARRVLGAEHADGRGRAQGRHHVRKHGRFLARRGRAQGRRPRQAARGAHAAREPGHLHGRQVRRRGAHQPRAQGRASAPGARVEGQRCAGRRRGELSMAEKQQAEAQAAESLGVDEFAQLLSKEFKPKSDRARQQVEIAVQTLAQQVLSDQDVIVDDAVNSINALIAEIDAKLAEQINLIIHHPEFQQLEGSWRGLHFLVNNTETDEMLKIRVLPISKNELGKTIKRYKGTAWDQSPLFKKVYEQEFGQLGGEPYGCLVGDYHFDHSPPDVEILSGMAQIAAAAHAPFISGAAPSSMQMDSWQELTNPRDLTKIFTTPEYAA